MIKIFDSENKEVEFNRISYPDTQQSVEILSLPEKRGSFTIVVRLNSFRAVELLLATVAALKALVPSFKLTVKIVYLLGGRSDRQMSMNSPNYLRDVIGPVLNLITPTRVIIMDPHSYVSEAVIKKSSAYSILPTLLEKYFSYQNLFNRLKENKIQIVAPDAGATARIHKTIDVFRKISATNSDVAIKIIQCIKTRDEKGAVNGLKVCDEYEPDVATVVMDDLCDGGKTFIEVANKIHVKDICLIVAHGVFSKGVEPVIAEYEMIFTTNSYRDFEPNINLDVHKVI